MIVDCHEIVVIVMASSCAGERPPIHPTAARPSSPPDESRACPAWQVSVARAWLTNQVLQTKGLAQVIKHENQGTLAALSLIPIHSLRHRLVRSRQSAHEDVAGFLRF